MNKRMKELANQCHGENGLQFDHEKYAELIIKECLKVIEQSDSECQDEWDYAERDLCGTIKEHFGIDEKPKNESRSSLQPKQKI